MRKILAGATLLALSAGFLTGCSGMIDAIEKSANYTDVEKIDYNLYRISGTRQNINQQLQLREFLYQRAHDFCMRNGQGAQLIDGVSGKNPKGEVGIMKGPEKEFIDNSPEADAARAEAARIAREKAEEEAEAKAEQEASEKAAAEKSAEQSATAETTEQ